MLSNIIGEEKPSASSDEQPSKKQTKKSKNEDDDDDCSSSSSPERLKTKLIESMKSKRESAKKSTEAPAPVKVEKIKEEPSGKMWDYPLSCLLFLLQLLFQFHCSQNEKPATPAKKINYSFYDPEMHWCTTCNVFPKTAKDYLNHLHSEEHGKNCLTPDTPWHENVVNDVSLNKFELHENHIYHGVSSIGIHLHFVLLLLFRNFLLIRALQQKGHRFVAFSSLSLQQDGIVRCAISGWVTCTVHLLIWNLVAIGINTM